MKLNSFFFCTSFCLAKHLKSVFARNSVLCGQPLELVFLQDSTSNFSLEAFANVLNGVQDFARKIASTNPGSAFALSDFKDKPYLPVGAVSDYCYNFARYFSSAPSASIEQNRTAAEDTYIDEFLQAYKQITLEGGGDLLNSQLEALVAITQERNIRWQTANRFVILITAGAAHVAGDLAASIGPYYPDESPITAFPDSDLSRLPIENCAKYEYPTLNQIKAYANSVGVKIIVVSPTQTAEFWNTFVSETLGEDPGFSQAVDSTFSNVTQALDLVYNLLDGAECVASPSIKSEVANTVAKWNITGDGNPVVTDVAGGCGISPIDFLILQETTSEFGNARLDSIKSSLDGVLTKLDLTFPQSRIAISEFRDKMYAPLGGVSDFCYYNALSFTTNLDDVIGSFNLIRAEGGGDAKNAQLTALISAATTTQWSTNQRIVLLVTSTEPHTDGDSESILSSFYPLLGAQPPFPNASVALECQHSCSHFDYPSTCQVKQALTEKNIQLAVIATTSVAPFWNDFIRNQLQEKSVYFQEVQDNFANFENAFLRILSAINDCACTSSCANLPGGFQLTMTDGAKNMTFNFTS